MKPKDPLIELAEAAGNLVLGNRDWREKIDGNCPKHGAQLFGDVAENSSAPCRCFEARVIRALLALPPETLDRLPDRLHGRLIGTPEGLRPVPSYGDMMTVEEFQSSVDCGAFIDYDGFGNMAMENGLSDIEVRPSTLKQLREQHPNFTHVCWYNR